MPDLNYLSRVLYILINCFFKQIVDIFFNNAYYQESYKLIIEYSSVITCGYMEVLKVQQWFDSRKSHNMLNTCLSLTQLKVKVHIFKNKRINL